MAYKKMQENPNSYFYRFNKPGEPQRNGPWTAEEEQRFLERLRTHPPNKEWGLFSVGIPGRVGYQCSNFYRRLIKLGAPR